MLIFSPTTDQKATKLRLYIDINPTDRDQGAEVERLLVMGACRADVRQTGEANWRVLPDQEGNGSCLLRRQLS